ncbi:AraC family transcriptional regulator [Paenibacillus thermotolerans]|uniref:AraC family transcriptional regulator n=1 Tax=Paenibacillus thermotolerans TaxID=3027807 RepID=UPI0023677BEE|nr:MULTISPECIES: AraC family transcriptional regulator [unclassified Paenibacillus]
MKIRLCRAGSISRSDEAPGGGMHPSLYEILYITSGKVRFRWMTNFCETEAPAVFIMSVSTPHLLESLYAEAKFRFIELADWDNFALTDKQIDQWNFMQTRKELFNEPLVKLIIQSLDLVYSLQSTGAALQDEHLEEVCLLEIRKTYNLIACILNNFTNGAPSGVLKLKPKPREMAELLIEFMDAHYRDEITLKHLAELVHLHPSYLVRMFKKQTNTTPFDYLRDLRLKAAVRYLSVTEMPISAIVEETGFRSVHYFSRLFKQAFGQSPAEWRKQMKRLNI